MWRLSQSTELDVAWGFEDPFVLGRAFDPLVALLEPVLRNLVNTVFKDPTRVLTLQPLAGSNEGGRRWRRATTIFGVLSDLRFFVVDLDPGIDNKLSVVCRVMIWQETIN